MLPTEIFNKIDLAESQAIFDKFMQSLPSTSSFAAEDDVNNSIASSLENFRAKFANGELRSIIQAETKNLVTKEDSLAIATSAIHQHGFATKENVIKDISQIKDGLEASINEKSAALNDSLTQQLASKDTVSTGQVKEIVGLAVHDSEANAPTQEEAITSVVDNLTVKVLSQGEVSASVDHKLSGLQDSIQGLRFQAKLAGGTVKVVVGKAVNDFKPVVVARDNIMACIDHKADILYEHFMDQLTFEDMVGKQEVVTIISNTIHELDASILTQEDANALTTVAANKVQISLEERLDIIDAELAKASSASSAAQYLISDNPAAVSGKVDDSLQALDCLSNKVTAMLGYIDDEVTAVKVNTARLSDDLQNHVLQARRRDGQ